MVRHRKHVGFMKCPLLRIAIHGLSGGDRHCQSCEVRYKRNGICNDECPAFVQFLHAMLDAFPRLEKKPLGDGRVMFIRWS